MSAFRSTLTAAPLLCTGRILDSIPDTSSSLAVAFSVRRVFTSYQGPCLRVRRSSDQREADIGFAQTDLDLGALEAFADGFDCFVVAWYDQTGKGRHATQDVAALQPQLVEAGLALFDAGRKQISIRFNGAYLKTPWEPTPEEMGAGAGILAAGSVGLGGSDVPTAQTGRISEFAQANLAVPTDFPSVSLPADYNQFLLEGFKAKDGANVAVVFSEGGNIHTLAVDGLTGETILGNSDTGLPVPRGPPTLTVDALALPQEAAASALSKWRHAVVLNGRVFAIPYSATKVLEINPVTQTVVARNLPSEMDVGQQNQANKWWMGVANAAKTVAYCIPAGAARVLVIDATDPNNTVISLISAPEFGTETPEKWHDGVLAGDGAIYAVPHNATTVLRINTATRVVTTLDLGSFGLDSGGAYWSAAALGNNGKVYGVPWNAACILEITPTATTPFATVALVGSTGLTPRIVSPGRGYTVAPTLTVGGPADTSGTTATMTAQLTLGKIVTAVAVAVPGSGYSATPRVIVRTGGSVENSGLINFERLMTVAPTLTPVMTPVDALNLGLGYKVSAVTVVNGGDCLVDTPSIEFDGGKGEDARAQAVVVKGRVLLINVPFGSEGTGYVTNPTVVISGGGGTGAAAFVSKREPLVPNGVVDGVLTSTGGRILAVTMTSEGAGYTSPPTVTFEGGRGEDARVDAAGITLVTDGKITGLTVSGGSGGSNYAVENNGDASAPGVRQLIIGTPASTGGNPAGQQAYAKISSVSGTGAITAIEMVNCGSGYAAAPTVTLRTGTANVTATFAPDGMLTGYTMTTKGTKYTSRPLIEGQLNRGQGATPGSPAIIEMRLEGTCSGADGTSPYSSYTQLNSGNEKFAAAYVPPGGTAIYSLPHSTHRGLRIDTTTGALADVLPTPNVALFGFGALRAQFKAGVATPDGSAFYGLPWNRKALVKITSAGVATTFGTFNGRWTSAAAGFNGNMYAVPAESSSMLVIDGKSDLKSDLVTFPATRDALATVKWSSVVAAGATLADGLLYAVPEDAETVLEINPGTLRRGTSLPAAACVIPDQGALGPGKRVVFAPGRSRVVTVYDPFESPAIARTFPITAAGNVSYADAVALPDGNVIFVPCYNATDAFPYTGNVGVFNTTSNTFSYGPGVSLEISAPYPSRSAAALGTTIGGGKLVYWVPREGTAALVLYNHNAPNSAANAVTETQRTETRVRYATSRRVGTDSDGAKVVVTQPSESRADILAAPVYALSQSGQRFGGAALADNAIVLVPGDQDIDIVLFYPSTPGAVQNSVIGSGVLPTTKIAIPADVRRSFAQTIGQKFAGAVYANEKVYAIPHQRTRVLAIDTQSYTVEEFGDFTVDMAEAGGALWHGGALGIGESASKIFCAPYGARRVMVIDTASQNPATRVTYVGSQFAAGGEKWRGAACTKDGRIVMAPYDANSVLVVDPVAETTTELTGFTWLTGTGKFSGCVTSRDGLVYLIPYNSRYLIEMNPVGPTGPTFRQIDTQLVDYTRRFSAGFQSPVQVNNKLYLIPERTFGVLEYDPETDDITLLGKDYGWLHGAVARDGCIYGFPGASFSTDNQRRVLKITPGAPYVAVYNNAGTDTGTVGRKWTQCRSIPQSYRLRPFLMRDTNAVLFHTGGTSASGVECGIFNSNNATANTVVAFGPEVRDGVATALSELDDRMLSVRGNNVSVLNVFEGGVGGVKSFSGNADLFVGIDNTDVLAVVGNATTTARSVFETIFDNGAPGVYGGFGSQTDAVLDLYVRDVALTSAPFAWTGQVGNTFGVGRVDGTRIPEVGAPRYARSFNGQISELLAFSSDQAARGAVLGESASFYFLDSKLQTATALT